MQHDKAGDWTDATCASTAQIFLDAAKEQGDTAFNEALYNAGLANQRCKKEPERRRRCSSRSSARIPSSTAPRCSSRSTRSPTPARRTSTRPSTRIREAAVVDAQFKNVEALVEPRDALHQAQQQGRGPGRQDRPGSAPRGSSRARSRSTTATCPPSTSSRSSTSRPRSRRPGATRSGRVRVGSALEGEEGRHAGARARGARLLAGHPQEPEVRARSTTRPG